MSVSSSSSFPCIKLRNPISATPSLYYTFKFTVLSSQAESPLRRPVSPAVKPVQPTSPLPPKPSAVVGDKSVTTLENQRQKAKELQEFFKKKKLYEANQGPFFGFISKNEISNGRWAMFGFAVGMLTE